MSEEKVDGQEGSFVADMIKQHTRVKQYRIAQCHQARFMGQEEAPSARQILTFFLKPDAEPKKRNQMLTEELHPRRRCRRGTQLVFFTIGKRERT